MDLLFAHSVFVSFSGTECVGPIVCRQCICIFYWHSALDLLFVGSVFVSCIGAVCWTCCLQAVYLHILLAQSITTCLNLLTGSVFPSGPSLQTRPWRTTSLPQPLDVLP